MPELSAAPATPTDRSPRGRARGATDGASAPDRLVRPAAFAPVLLALVAVVSACYAARGLPNPDEGAVLTNAAKILRGGVFYRDIDAYPFPGSYYLLAAAMAVFGEHLTVARWLAAAVYAGVVASLYAAALPLLGRRGAALFGLSLLSLKFLTWPGFSSYLYSDVGFLGACAAIALLVRHRFDRATLPLALAGVCAGCALAAKQNIGLYLGAAVGLLIAFPRAFRVGPVTPWRSRIAQLAAFGAGAAGPIAPMVAYFAAHGVLGRMLESGFVRPFTGYLPTSGIDFAPMLFWWRLGSVEGRAAAPYFVADYWHLLMQDQLPGAADGAGWWLAGEIASRVVYTSLPIAFAWFALRFARGRRARPGTDAQRVLFVYGFVSIPVVLTAFPRADAFHVFSVYALVVLLLAALARPAPAERPSVRGRVAAVAVALLLVSTGALAAARHRHLDHRLSLERADVWVDPSDAWVASVVEFVRERVPEGEPLFVYGHEAHLYFLTGRFFPWPFPQLYPGQEGGDGGAEIAARLRDAAPDVVLQGVLRWPGVPVLPEYAPALDRAVRADYARDADFFRREHPNGAAPPDWVLSVLRREPRAEASGRKRSSDGAPTGYRAGAS